MSREFTIECFIELALGLVVIALRIYSRSITIGVRNLELDDYGMIFAAVPYIGLFVTAYRVDGVLKGFSNLNMTDEYRESLSPASEEYNLRTRGAQNHLIGWYVYLIALWTLKVCVVIFYRRLTEGVDRLRGYVNIIMGSLIASYIVVNVTISADCLPFRRHWQIYPFPGDNCQIPVSKLNLLTTAILNFITDVALLGVPVLLIYKVRMPMKKKVVLSAMFGGSIFVIACGVLRAVLVLVDGAASAEESGNWAAREAYIGVITSNTPMVQSLIRHWVRKTQNKGCENSNYATPHSVQEGSRGTKLRSFAIHSFGESTDHIVGAAGSNNGDSESAKELLDNGIHVTTKTTIESDGNLKYDDLKYMTAAKLGLHDKTAYKANISTKNNKISE